MVRAYQQALSRLRVASARQAQAVWQTIPGIDEKYVPQFAEQAAAATAPYRRVAVQLASGLTMHVVGDLPDGDLVDAEEGDPEVWRQPFISTWQALASQRGYDAALVAGFLRAAMVGKDEVTSASRGTMKALGHDRIIGWRRALTSPACEWCTTVADQLYHSAESADFGHEGCECEPYPVTADDE